MNYAVVGAFVLLLAAALVAGVLWLASGGALAKQYDLYLAIEEESVSGLNLNAPVKFNGVTVGKVQDIQLDPANPERVRLLFSIQRGTPIKEDTVAVLSTQGLTGIAFVELDGGSPAAAPLQAIVPEQYPVIRTKPSLGARLENVLTNALTKLDRTSSNIDALLSDENRIAVKNALADIAALAHTIAARKGTIDSAIANAARTFDNTARAAPQIDPLFERIGRSADAVDKMADEAALASTNAAKAVDSVGADVKHFTAGTLPELQNLLVELNALSNSLRRLSEQIERDPSALVRGRSPPADGPGESAMGKR